MIRILRNFILLPGLCVLAFAALSCAGNAQTKSSGNFADVRDKDWALEEVRINSAVTRVNEDGIFTLRFDAERAAGTGAPNQYTVPYTPGEGSALSMGMAAATRMASLVEAGSLKEQEYFAYLAKVNAWELKNGKLELKSSTADGSPVVLVFQIKN